MNKMKEEVLEEDEEILEKGFRIYCRSCGCEYMEPITWVEDLGYTECPNCGYKLGVE